MNLVASKSLNIIIKKKLFNACKFSFFFQTDSFL